MRRLVLLVVLAFAAPIAVAGMPSAVAAAEPAQPEVQEPFRPSGFWTSPHRAKGGAYRYRMLAIGLGLMAVTGFVMWRLVKKAAAERERRARQIEIE